MKVQAVPVNPFSARSGVDPKVFIGRKEELKFFHDDRLTNAIRGRCQHYVITGKWGIGKTVLLRQLKLMSQKQGVWALLFCVRGFGSHERLTDFAHHVLDMAASDLPIQPKKKGNRLKSAGASALGFGLQFAWGSRSEDKEMDPQLVLREGLLKMHDHAIKHGGKALVLLIDDVQNLPMDGQQLTLLRNVLTDEKVAGRAKILVVLSSSEEGWTPFLLRDHPVGRLFLPRRTIGRFDKNETISLIDECLKGTGIIFNEGLKNRIHQITQGHIFEIQALCESLFDRQIKGRVSMESWDTALQQTLLSLSDAQFRGMLGRASNQELLALKELANHPDGLRPTDLEKRCPHIKSAAEVLKRLTEKDLTERVKRGEYLISDRLFMEYIRRTTST